MIDGECVHCLEFVANLKHWQTCTKHPARIEIDSLKALLKRVEWGGYCKIYKEHCPLCHGTRPTEDNKDDPYTPHHTPECELARVLK